jgi:hypothetical protein
MIRYCIFVYFKNSAEAMKLSYLSQAERDNAFSVLLRNKGQKLTSYQDGSHFIDLTEVAGFRKDI